MFVWQSWCMVQKSLKTGHNMVFMEFSEKLNVVCPVLEDTTFSMKCKKRFSSNNRYEKLSRSRSSIEREIVGHKWRYSIIDKENPLSMLKTSLETFLVRKSRKGGFLTVHLRVLRETFSLTLEKHVALALIKYLRGNVKIRKFDWIKTAK